MKNGKILNILLFSVLGGLLATSAYFLYLNIEKNSKLKVEKSEIAVQMLSFDELPKDEQDKYIKKENIDSYSKFLTPQNYEKKFNIGSVNDNIPENLDELKKQVGDLRVQNKLLYDDNVNLINKNLEIAKLLSEKQSQPANQSVNLRSIVDSQNSVETINDLKKRLEEAQGENLQNSKISSQRIVSLENEIDALKAELERRQKDFDKAKIDIVAKTNEEISKELKFQIDERAKVEKELLKAREEFIKLKDENTRLADNLSLKESEAKRIAAEQGERVAKIQNALQDEIGVVKKEFDAKKIEYEKDIKTKQSEIDALEKERSAMTSSIKELEKKLESANSANERNLKFKALNEEQNATIEQLRSRIQKEREGFQRDMTQMWGSHKSEIDKLKKELEESTLKAQEIQIELKNKVAELTNLNLKKDEVISQNELNLTALNSELNIQKERLENEVAANRKNIQNYKILNDKITSLIQSNATINKEAKKRVDEAESVVNAYKQTIDDLNLTIAKKDKEIKDATTEFEKLKAVVDTQNKKEEALRQNAQNDNKNPLVGEVINLKRQIAELMSESDYLTGENENLKKIIQLNFRAEVPKKVVFIASIECNDMVAGSDKPTTICKNRVSEFLQNYNSNYYFEIIPIVSQDNFIATSKAAQVIPKNELEKINAYANFGIGKERAKTAGELVKDEFGEFSRISYSNEIITSSNKQGFVIKVYR